MIVLYNSRFDNPRIILKTLKNPSRPQSKGNLWSVEVRHIQKEHLQLQNVDVSRDAEQKYVNIVQFKVRNLKYFQ